MKNYRKTLAALILASALFQCGHASAQEIDRGNPFAAPPSWSEEQARMDERTRIIYRELEPELKNDIMKRVNESQAALEIKMRKRIDLVVQNIGPAAAAAEQTNAAGKDGAVDPNASAVPADSTFISCVNKKALYRDKNNTLFRVPEEDPQSVARCGK